MFKKGQIYNWCGLPVKIIEVASSGEQVASELVTVLRKWGGEMIIPASELEPIAITPYYLVTALHFELVGENQVILEKRTSRYHCVMVWTHVHTWCLIMDDGAIVTEIKYLHELQNLFASHGNGNGNKVRAMHEGDS